MVKNQHTFENENNLELDNPMCTTLDTKLQTNTNNLFFFFSYFSHLVQFQKQQAN